MRFMTHKRTAAFNTSPFFWAGVDDEVKKRNIRNHRKADPAYGEGVLKVMGIALAD